MKKIEVVAGIVFFEDEILCVQRGESKLSYISKKFEFPGGKVEIGESKEEALKRELQEELSITPDIKDLYLTVIHQYPDFEITMHSFLCESDSKNLNLTEHIAAKWFSADNLDCLDWAAADIPIVKKLMTNG